MKRFMTTVVLVVSASSVAFAQEADILRVIPESSLVAVMTKSVSGAEKHFGELTAKFDAKLPTGSVFGAVLAMFDIAGEDPVALAKAATVDLDGPMALVLVVPAHHIPGKPVGVVLKPTDYRKMLQELVRIADAAAVEITPDGTDVVNGEDGVAFAARLGDFAVVAEAEYVVKTFKNAANKTLATASVPGLRKTFLENDFAVYVNLNDLVTAYDPQIAMFRRMMRTAMENAPAPPGMPADRDQRVRMLDAQVDLMLKVAQQTEALCAGLRTDAEGAQAVASCQARADSALERALARLEPAPVRLMNSFDAPIVMALEQFVRPDAVDPMQQVFDEYLLKSGTVKDKDALREFNEKERKQRERTTGRTALVWTPPDAGKGVVRMVVIEETRPGAEALEKELDDILNLKQTLGQIEMEVDVKEDVEKHRGTSIDLARILFKGTPDAAEEVDQMVGIIRTLFGPAMVVYGAELAGCSVATVGHETTAVLKDHMDRVLDRRGGNLLQSAAWREAVARLPEKRSGVLVVSLGELYRVLLPAMFERESPEAAREIRGVRFARPSAAGMTFGPAEGGAVVHVNVPVQEMLNVRTVFRALFKAFRRQMEDVEGGVDENAGN